MEPLAKRWEITEAALRDAHALLSTPDARVLDYLAHNELGLAFGDLVSFGREHSLPSVFWKLLGHAADCMSLNEHRADLRHRYREALELELAGKKN